MIDKNCPICEKKSHNIVYNSNLPKNIYNSNYSGRKTPDSYHYEMVRCNKCEVLYASAIYSESILETLYSISDFPYIEEVPGLKLTYKSCLNQAKEYIKDKINFLDIGCGNGFMLEVAYEIGWSNPVGVEPSSKAIEMAKPQVKKNIINKTFDANDFNKNFFDVIFCAMILEHVADINIFLKKIKSILKPGGIIIAVTHDEGHILARLLKNKHPIINDEHAYVFSSKSLNKIFKKHDYTIKKISKLKNIYTIKYWLGMVPIFKGLISIFSSILDKINILDSKVGIKAGNIYIIAQKPLK